MCPIVLDESVNHSEVIALNIFERVLLQSIRLSSFLRISPQWRKHENIHFILTFTITIADRIHKLTKKWHDNGVIKFTLNLKQIQWICAYAMLIQWTNGKVCQRMGERNAITFLVHFLEHFQSENTIKWKKRMKNNSIDFKHILISLK